MFLPPSIPTKDKPYYQRVLEETGGMPGQQGKGFTTVGKPKMTTKQYNSPIEIYGEEALDENVGDGSARSDLGAGLHDLARLATADHTGEDAVALVVGQELPSVVGDHVHDVVGRGIP